MLSRRDLYTAFRRVFYKLRHIYRTVHRLLEPCAYSNLLRRRRVGSRLARCTARERRAESARKRRFRRDDAGVDSKAAEGEEAKGGDHECQLQVPVLGKAALPARHVLPRVDAVGPGRDSRLPRLVTRECVGLHPVSDEERGWNRVRELELRTVSYSTCCERVKL